MLIDEFLEPRILIVSGKGGVGKTTVTAGLALVAARQGRKVCIAEVDRNGGLPALLGASSVGYDPKELSPGLWAMNIVPENALAEYLDVQYHMKRISRVFTHSHFTDYITAAAPGLKDILVLGKVWYLEQNRWTGNVSHTFDTIILDAPAAGHMRTFLAAPSGLSDAVRVGPVRRQADWILNMLRDPRRTRVHLVTLPEEMPVTETLETSRALHRELRISEGVTFVNAVYPESLDRTEQRTLRALTAEKRLGVLTKSARDVGLHLDGDDLDALIGHARFLSARRSIQARYLKELGKELDGALIELPFLFSAGLALPEIEKLADVMEEKIGKL